MRRYLPVVTVFAGLLLLVGCGGSSSPTSTDAARQAAAESQQSGSASAPNPVTKVVAPKQGAPAQGAGTKAAQAPQQRVQTQQQAQPQQQTAPQQQTQTQQQSAAAPSLTRPGRYTYDSHGTAKSPFGTKNLDGTATLTVDQPSGGRQHQALSGQDSTQEQVLVAAADGYRLSELKISTQGFSEDFRSDQPVLLLPAAPTAGQTWSWQMTSTDGKYTIHTTSKIVGTEQQTVGGSGVRTVHMTSSIHVSGDAIELTGTQDDWFSTAAALVVKEHAVMHGTGYGQTFDSDVTRTVRSMQPS